MYGFHLRTQCSLGVLDLVACIEPKGVVHLIPMAGNRPGNMDAVQHAAICPVQYKATMLLSAAHKD